MACEQGLACVGSGGCIEPLGVGSEGQVLAVVSGAPGWVDGDIHPAASVPGGNPALSIVAGTQVLNLDLSATGSFTPGASGLTSTNVQDAIIEAATRCCVGITSGVGAPAATTNSPTIYTDTATGTVYYRNVDGTVVVIHRPITTTSGTGAPAAGPNSPTVYTDTDNGDVYFRDQLGNVTVLTRGMVQTDPTGAGAQITDSVAGVLRLDTLSGTQTGNWTIDAQGRIVVPEDGCYYFHATVTAPNIFGGNPQNWGSAANNQHHLSARIAFGATIIEVGRSNVPNGASGTTIIANGGATRCVTAGTTVAVVGEYQHDTAQPNKFLTPRIRIFRLDSGNI